MLGCSSQVRPGRLGHEWPKGHAPPGPRCAPASRHGSDVDFDWHDRSTWPAALDGCDRAYLVPPAGLDVAPSMVPFIELAHGNGVERLVLLSNSVFPMGGPGVGAVHQALAEGGRRLRGVAALMVHAERDR